MKRVTVKSPVIFSASPRIFRLYVDEVFFRGEGGGKSISKKKESRIHKYVYKIENRIKYNPPKIMLLSQSVRDISE